MHVHTCDKTVDFSTAAYELVVGRFSESDAGRMFARKALYRELLNDLVGCGEGFSSL